MSIENAVPVWRDPRYYVDPDGGVYRVHPYEGHGKRWPLPHKLKPLMMGAQNTRSPHVRFGFRRNPISVARLVLEAFGEPMPNAAERVSYINGDRLDASLRNVKWRSVPIDNDLRERHLSATSGVRPHIEPEQPASPPPSGGAGDGGLS